MMAIIVSSARVITITYFNAFFEFFLSFFLLYLLLLLLLSSFLYCFYLPIFYTSLYRRQGRALVPSVIQSCDRNSAKSEIGFIRSKRGTVQP